MQRPVIVQRFSTRAEAETAKSALLARGVEAIVASDDGGSQYPGLGFAHGVDLLVDADQLTDAGEILRSAGPIDRST